MSCSQKAGLGAGGRGAGASSEVRAGGGGGEPGPAAGQPVLGGLDATQRMEGQLGPWARAMGREVGWDSPKVMTSLLLTMAIFTINGENTSSKGNTSSIALLGSEFTCSDILYLAMIL